MKKVFMLSLFLVLSAAGLVSYFVYASNASQNLPHEGLYVPNVRDCDTTGK